MPRVGPEDELRTLSECQYHYPGETLQDLHKVRSLFSDLRLHADFYCFPNNEKKKLLFLAGTLPVHYEGSSYNIPVCIWLHETHPASRPRCYVCPSVSMVINPSCPWVDSSGNISLDCLRNWTHGVSSLSLLLSEMKTAFQKHTPLYARCPILPATPAAVQGSGGSLQKSSQSSSSSSSQSIQLSPASSHLVELKEQSSEARLRTSYAEELLGIDFSPPPPSYRNPFQRSSSPSDHVSQMISVLRLDEESGGVARNTTPNRHIIDVCPEPNPPSQKVPTGLDPVRAELSKIAAQLPRQQAAIFLALMTMEGRSFSTADVIEAVQLNRDLQSALRFLTHTCPICNEQVSFSKIVTMTHCSCFLCRTCFTAFFSVAIRERSVDQLVCPQCGQPEVSGEEGLEESVEYFNLLDTQIRHFLPPEIHELFQRKLRDRALRSMPNFCWCAHCSFGMLHEVDQLKMDCPSCKKSTCSQCGSPWIPQHQGLSCKQFREWQQLQSGSAQLHSTIVCPKCRCIFSLSRGGCLHFTCSQCSHQFCGSCSQSFALGSICSFSSECGTKGLHAHHPRDCLYHLRDWTVTRLQLLLQHCKVSPSWVEPANGSSPQTACPVLELRDDGSGEEKPCGRPRVPEYQGYCELHYKERLVELIHRYHADPVVLFSVAEMEAELRRWRVTIPTRKPDEPEPLYTNRLRLMLTNRIPLMKK